MPNGRLRISRYVYDLNGSTVSLFETLSLCSLKKLKKYLAQSSAVICVRPQLGGWLL